MLPRRRRLTQSYDLGQIYFNERVRQHIEPLMLQCLEHLGYEVELKPIRKAT